MSRAGYSEDLDQWPMIRWRGQVASSIRGKRGQAFLRELLALLDAMPEKRLISGLLRDPGGHVCTLGCIAQARGLDVEKLQDTPATDYDEDDGYIDNEALAAALKVAEPLVREIEYENDECAVMETPEQRWERMRAWVAAQIKP